MRTLISLMTAAVLVAVGSASADEASRKRHERETATAVIGAAALLGIAALAHHGDHHQDGNHLPDADAEAWYEQGYRDALYGNPYDTDAPADVYGPG